MKKYTISYKTKGGKKKRVTVEANNTSEAMEEALPASATDVDVEKVEDVTNGEAASSGDNGEGEASDSGSGTTDNGQTDSGDEGDGVEILSVEEVEDDGEDTSSGDNESGDTDNGGSGKDNGEEEDEEGDKPPADEHWYFRKKR